MSDFDGTGTSLGIDGGGTGTPIEIPATSSTPIEVQIAEARLAYHQLITGVAPRVVVDQNGERVEFAAANRGNLALYIASLERLLAVPAGRPSGPAGFLF